MGYIEKETISRAQRPGPPRPISPILNEDRCVHNYVLINSDVEKLYADSEAYVTIVNAVFYCEKCLRIEQVSEHKVEGR